jgi:tetratricopeptide (TPR) repeat protein
MAGMMLLLISPPAANGQTAAGTYASVLDDPVVQDRVERGLDHLYNMEFDPARGYFTSIDRRYPDHPVGPFLLALNTWWEILLDLSDESRDDAFYDAMEEVMDRSDRLLKRDPDNFDAMFFKGAALGFRGRLRSNRGAWFRSARDGIRAMDYVLGVAERAPENADYAFGKGIYDYYASAIPSQYPYVKPVMIFFPNGDRARGIRELERTVREGRFIQTEAAYFLLQIYYLFEDDYQKAVHYVTWLRDRHPQNSFFHTFEGRVYAKWGQWEKSGAVFEEVLRRHRNRHSGYNEAMAEQALYFLARSRMMYRDYDQALVYLDDLKALAARDADDSYFEVLGRLREGMARDARGHRTRAVAAYREVLEMQDFAGAHERAKRFLDTPYKG